MQTEFFADFGPIREIKFREILIFFVSLEKRVKMCEK